MFPAASRFLFCFGLGALALPLFAADAADRRAVPSRPGASMAATSAATVPGKKISGVEHVSLTDVAKRLGLKLAWLERGKRLRLSDPTVRMELENDSREILVDGLRVFLGERVVDAGGHLFVTRMDFDRCIAPLLRPGFGRPPLQKPRVIALDAGHGGDDPGMESKTLGLKESALTLDVVLRLKKLLERDGYQIVLTRTDDKALAADKRKDLTLRAAKANRAGADLLVSVHFNSLFPDTKTGGTEVFAYTARGQRSDQSWGFGQPDDRERDAMPVNRHDAWSTVLALRVQRAVLEKLKTTDRGFKTKHLLLFQDLNCPAVLIESLFLSNETEARRAATPESRQQIAEALATGIRDYASLVEARAPAAPSAKAAPAERRSAG